MRYVGRSLDLGSQHDDLINLYLLHASLMAD